MRVKRRTKRVGMRVLIAIPLILVAAFLYMLLRNPSSAAPSKISVAMTPDRIERGAISVHHAARLRWMPLRTRLHAAGWTGRDERTRQGRADAARRPAGYDQRGEHHVR